MDSHQGSRAAIPKSPEFSPESAVRGAWRPWAALLRRRHLAGLAAWLLDAGRPLALVSAQFLYMGEPLLGEGARQLGRLLESESETDDFIDELSIDEGPGSRTMQGDA